MRTLLLLITIFGLFSYANAWETDEEINPTPHEEYESPAAEYLVQEIAGIIIQDIQVKYIIKSSRGKNFLRDLHGSTEISLPAGMYKIVGDGILPITKFEAEDAKKMIVDYYIWTSISHKDDQKNVAKTLYGYEKKSEVKKADLEDMKKEIATHKAYYRWFTYYYERLNSGEILPDQVMSQVDFKKAIDDGKLEVDALE